MAQPISTTEHRRLKRIQSIAQSKIERLTANLIFGQRTTIKDAASALGLTEEQVREVIDSLLERDRRRPNQKKKTRSKASGSTKSKRPMEKLVAIIRPVLGPPMRVPGQLVWLTSKQIRLQGLKDGDFKVIKQRPLPSPRQEQPSKAEPVPTEEKPGQVTDRAIKQPRRHRMEINEDGDVIFRSVFY